MSCDECKKTTSGVCAKCFYQPPIEQITFVYEYVAKQEDVRKHIQECEGKHVQQAIYSTFHDALTQVCFGCQRVRSTIKR